MPGDVVGLRVMSLMTTGELSRRTGLPVKAVREYTDAGLIYSVGRTPPDIDCLPTRRCGASR